MKYVTRSIFVLSLIYITSLTPVLAATTTPKDTAVPTPPKDAVVLARVNVQNCLLSANKDVVTITCDFNNNGAIQTDIRYAVDLVQGEGTSSKLIDEKIYPDAVSLAENQSLHKVIAYTIPAYVDGTAQVWIRASNSEGLPLAQSKVGMTSHTATTGVSISSCYLVVMGDKKGTKYSLSQGVDIKPSENLLAHCQLSNLGKTPLLLTPYLETHERNSFGAVVPAVGVHSPDITIEAGQSAEYSFVLPKPTKPQAYDTSITFLALGKPASQTLAFHYVIQGASATVQNISIDKTAYQKGDTAMVTTFWTGSADAFPGSRGGATKDGATSITASITSHGASCGDVTQPADATKTLTSLPVPISISCTDPAITVKVLDANGQVLAEKTIGVPSNLGKPGVFGNANIVYLIMLIGGLLLALVAIFLKRSYQKKGSTPSNTPTNLPTSPTPPSNIIPMLFLPLLVTGMFLTGAQGVRADTFKDVYDLGLTGGGVYCDAYGDCFTDQTISEIITTTFTVNIDKSTPYAPGEQINATGVYVNSSCSNGGTAFGATLIVTNVPDSVSSSLTWPKADPSQFNVAQNALFTAPATAGNYIMRFLGRNNFGVTIANGQALNPNPGTTHDIPYSVSGGVPAPTASLTPAQQTITSGNTATLTYSCTDSVTASIDQGVMASTGTLSGTKTVSPTSLTTYTLTCTGPLGTTPAQASATVDVTAAVTTPTPVNGSCGTTNNSCTAGTAVHDTDTSTQYLWHCNGTNGGSPSGQCSATIPTTPTCPSWQYWSGTACVDYPTVVTNLTADIPTPWTGTPGVPLTITGVVRNNGDLDVTSGFTNLFQVMEGDPLASQQSNVPGNKPGNGTPYQPTETAYRYTSPYGYPMVKDTINIVPTSITDVGTFTSPPLQHPGGQVLITPAVPAHYVNWSFDQYGNYVPGHMDWGSPAVYGPGISTASGTITRTFTTGTHYVRVCADKASASDTGVIVEDYEYDNCSAWTAIDVGDIRPDLTAGAITPTTLAPGYNLTIGATISNIGNGTANTSSGGGSFYNSFQRANDINGTGATWMAPSILYTPFVKGASSNISTIWNFPTVGVYYIRACADTLYGNSGIIDETNENNNCGPWTAVNVTNAQPDLTPTSLSPTTVVAGQSSTFTAGMLNTGTLLTPSFGSTIYVCDSADSACLGNSFALRNGTFWQKAIAFFKVAVAHAATSIKITLSNITLAAGASGNQTGSYTFGSAGTYSMRLCADLPLNQVPELDENNNCGSWQVLVVCPAGNTVSPTGACVPPGPPATACTVSPTTLPATGGTVTYSANPSNGATTPYTWTPSDGVGTYGTANTATRVFTAADKGSQYGMTVTASPSGTSNCPSVPVGTVCSGTPIGTLSATPNRIRANVATSVTFSLPSVTNVKTSCTLTGPGVNQTYSSNACAVSASYPATLTIATQGVYTLTCDGVKTATTIVNVIPNFVEF